MISQYLGFFILALVTLVAAYKVVTARLITHAALWMALSFTAVAGVFLMMQQEFVAALQVLVYAGAITTMVIFAIMLSEIREIKTGGDGGARTWLRRSAPLATLIGLIFAAFMTFLYVTVKLPSEAMDVAGPLSVKEIGGNLFTRFTVPFEIASIILLIAMIGAIILTAKETE